MKTFLFLVLLNLAVVFAYDNCKKNVTIDHYKLRYEWEPTSCISFRCTPEQKNSYPSFVVHGLWPNNFNTWETNYCCTDRTEYFEKEIRPLENKLKDIWLQPADLGFVKFWKHEYSKHGTCAQHPKIQGIQNFFNYTYDLARQISVNGFLQKNGFKPEMNVYVEQFLDAFKKNYGSKPEIRCKLVNNVSYLENIGFCFDKNLKMMDCRSRPQCKNSMIIPSFRTVF